MNDSVAAPLASLNGRADGVAVAFDDHVLRVTLDESTRLNAQTPATWRRLASIGAAVESAGPQAVRAVILTGSGTSFSAGLDRRMFLAGIPGEPSLAELANAPRQDVDAVIAGYQSAFTWWRQVDAVTVAAVAGHAIGAGFQLALACDIRIAATDVAFAMKEVTWGLVPDLGGTSPLVQTVGYAKALEWCATGRVVAAPEALATGLVSEVVDPDDLMAAAERFVSPLVGAPAGVVAATKSLLRNAVHASPHDQRAVERATQIARLRALAAGPGE